MFETEPDGWLAEVLDACSGGLPLDGAGCARLARGFVGCNLAAHASEFFTGIANTWPGGVFGGYEPPSYRHLREWLANPPASWSDLEALTGAGASAAMAGGPHSADPWWQIDRWLVIESFLTLLAESPRLAAVGDRPSVFGHAREANRRLLANNLEPAACNCRSDSVEKSFEEWWFAGVACAVELWRRESWHEQPSARRHTVGNLMAVGLHESAGPSLQRLVGTKNNQVSACVRALNERIAGPTPVPEGWTGRLASQVLDAWSSGDDFTFSATDLQHLAALGIWLAGPRLVPLRLPLQNAFAGFLSPPAASATFPNAPLAGVVGVLNDVSRESPRRGLPLDWPTYPQVPDLFFYPVRPGTDFSRWARLLETLDGIGPVA